MYTSYFAKYKKKDGVSIALKSPFFYECSSYYPLFPTWDLINAYKTNKITSKEYTVIYNKQLSKLNPQKVYNDLKGKVLLCWERSDQFCHRFLVAKWIEDELEIKVPEIGVEIIMPEIEEWVELLKIVPNEYDKAIKLYPWLPCSRNRWESQTALQRTIYLIKYMKSKLIFF